MASIVASGTFGDNPGDNLGFGIQLPIQSKSHTFVEAWEEPAGIDDLTAVAQACDRAGFLYVGVCDHTAIPEESAPRRARKA